MMQKNFGQAGHRDAEFADSVAVADFYQHLHDCLRLTGLSAWIRRRAAWDMGATPGPL